MKYYRKISYVTVDGSTAVILHIGDYLVDVFYTCRGVEYILCYNIPWYNFPSQFGLINLQISCQIVSKMIGVIRFREGYYVVPLSFKGNQKLCNLTYPFLIKFYYKLW